MSTALVEKTLSKQLRKSQMTKSLKNRETTRFHSVEESTRQRENHISIKNCSITTKRLVLTVYS